MINANEMNLIERFADEIRHEFRIPEDDGSLANDVKIILYRKVWDVVGNIEYKYRKEFELYAKDSSEKLK